VHQPRLLTNINKMYHNQDVLLKVYQYIYATSSINHVPTILLAIASNNVPSMYQSCINYRSNYDSSICTNITISYTSCMCQLINYMSQHLPNIYLNHIPKIYANITNKISLAIHHNIHRSNTINPHIKPCSKPHYCVASSVYQSYTKTTNKRLS
jgi:hypothetical protein